MSLDVKAANRTWGLVRSAADSFPTLVSPVPFDGIAGPLHKHSLGHWNSTVEGLAQNVLKMYMEFDIHLYDRFDSD